jgi:putative two-component system response regulator
MSSRLRIALVENLYMPRASANILVVDDSPLMQTVIADALAPMNHCIHACSSGRDALARAAELLPDVILLDRLMPEMDGLQVLHRLSALPATAQTPVIMVTSCEEPEHIAEALEAGAVDYVRKPISAVELRARVASALRWSFSQRELTTALAQAEEALKAKSSMLIQASQQLLGPLPTECGEQSPAQLNVLKNSAVLMLARIAECRDNDTGQHLLRLREYSRLLAEELREMNAYPGEIDDQFLLNLDRASPLHDIGKVGIPDAILHKPGRLTPEEFAIMKRHTIIGANVLQDAVLGCGECDFLIMASQVAQYHHERWDGKGYHAGLRGLEIPLAARIVSVADVYDALTTERPYKSAWDPEAAKETILDGAGTQFDPLAVEAFSRIFDEFRQVQHKHAEQNATALGAMAVFEVLPPE